MKVKKELPRGGKRTLARAVNRASRARQHSDQGDWRTFELAFAAEFAKMIERHGLGSALRSLFRYEDRIEMPCGISFLEEGELQFAPGDARIMPCAFEARLNLAFDPLKHVECIVELAILRSSMVSSYVVYGEGNLSGECRVRLTGDVFATIPEWEVEKVIAKYRDDIEYIAPK